MSTSDDMARIQPERLHKNSLFSFSCHKGVSCFTSCCRGIRILLTPYDILRLKNRLGLSSEDFLALYTDPQLLEQTDLPMVTLKSLDDDHASCPFVRKDGCLIYADRPTACRYYPLGVAALSYKEESEDKDFFFLIREPHCRGFEASKEWSVVQWQDDQEVALRDRINAGWTDLIVRKKSFPATIKLSEPSKKMFFMASYNIDQFRKFVFESTFLTRYEIPRKTLDEIRADETALLTFAIRWLTWVLFKEGAFDSRTDASFRKQ